MPNLSLQGSSVVRAAHACCCLKTLFGRRCAASRPDLTACPQIVCQPGYCKLLCSLSSLFWPFRPVALRSCPDALCRRLLLLHARELLLACCRCCLTLTFCLREHECPLGPFVSLLVCCCTVVCSAPASPLSLLLLLCYANVAVAAAAMQKHNACVDAR